MEVVFINVYFVEKIVIFFLDACPLSLDLIMIILKKKKLYGTPGILCILFSLQKIQKKH